MLVEQVYELIGCMTDGWIHLSTVREQLERAVLYFDKRRVDRVVEVSTK